MWISDTGTPKLISASVLAAHVGLPLGSTVVRSTAQGAVANQVTTLVWDGSIFDTLGYWNAGDPGVFTIPCAGYYQLGFGIRLDNVKLYPYGIFVLKNGAEFPGGFYDRENNDVNAETCRWTAIVEASSGDKFNACFLGDTSTRTIAARNETFFSIQPYALYL